jgi:ATP-binding cassette subfamily B (MDR/TAP) protein 7
VLLKDPPILFFDEAVRSPAAALSALLGPNPLAFQTSQTSALDSETEMKLMTDVNSMLADQKRTSVFIAHR